MANGSWLVHADDTIRVVRGPKRESLQLGEHRWYDIQFGAPGLRVSMVESDVDRLIAALVREREIARALDESKDKSTSHTGDELVPAIIPDDRKR